MRTKSNKNTDIVVVGLGLMGASLALALQRCFRGKDIVALSRTSKKIRAALKKRIITWGSTDPKIAFANASMIVIATPVRTIKNFITLAEKHAPQGTIVTDVGSTKNEIVDWVAKKTFKNIVFVGSHPLAGSDKSGMNNAVKDLYKGEVCFVTPGTSISSKCTKAVVAFWEKIGSRVVVMNASMHDRLLAASSHYPHLLAFALVNATKRHCKQAINFVGTGFKDTTRIAASEPNIWYDIIASNKKNILRKNKEMIEELRRVNDLIRRGDAKKIKNYLSRAKEIRETI
ncbi:prephenate dehydrogenase [Candidatus Omnitrophota bacterium]